MISQPVRRLKKTPIFPYLTAAFTLVGLFGLSVLSSFLTAPSAAAGINQQMNYQGRLLTAAGAVVPDGTYNLEFKLYTGGTGCVSAGVSPCGGTNVWTEDWVYGTGAPDNRIIVRNGYFSVSLGSVTSMASVDFNNDTLWLSANVGNTSLAATFAGAAGDGEMLPFKRLASSPYAMNAGNLGGIAAANYVQFASGNLQADASTNASIQINKTGATGSILDLQKGGAGVVLVNNSGQTLLRPTVDSQTALQVQKAGTTTVVFTVDSTNTRIGIGTGAPAYAVDAVGSVNASIDLKVAGTTVCTATGCTAASGSGNYIQNQSAAAQSANFFIQSSAAGSIGAIVRANAAQSVDIFAVQDSAGAINYLNVRSTGNVGINAPTATNKFTVNTLTTSSLAQASIGTASDANIAFLVQGFSATQAADLIQVQNSGSEILSRFTSNGQLTLGRINTTGSTQAGILTLSDGTLDNFGVALKVATITGSNKTYTIPNSTAATDTFCLLTVANCASGGTVTLQNGYTASTGGTTPEIKLDATRGAIDIQDADTTIAGNLLSIHASNGAGLGVTLFGINSTGQTTFQNSVNSVSALSVKNANSAAVFNVDTATNKLSASGILNLDTVTAPATSPTFNAFVAAGALTGSYYYVQSFTTVVGSTEHSIMTTVISPVGQNVTLNIATSANPLVTGRNIYRSASLGGPYQLAGTVANNTSTTFTDSNTTPTTFASKLNQTALLLVGGSQILTVSPFASGDTFIGIQAGLNTTTGLNNTGIGTSSLSSLTTGLQNTAVGSGSLFSNTTGNYNSALGFHALFSNTSGYSNVAVGQYSLVSNDTGINNTAIGDQALISNTSGSLNVALGAAALSGNTTGTSNIAVGPTALMNNTIGVQNIAIGEAALGATNIGSQNTGTGGFVLQLLMTLSGAITTTATNAGKAQFTTLSTTGLTIGTVITVSGGTSYDGTQTVQSVDSATTFTITAAYLAPDAGSWSTGATDNNTAYGYQAGYGNASGYTATGNSIFGANSGLNLQNGANYNSLFGFSAGSAITTGKQNVVLGYNAGLGLTTGSNNVLIGQNVAAANPTGSNQLQIGVGLSGDLSTGSFAARSTTNSTASFQIQNAAGSSVLMTDTTALNANVTNGSLELDTAGWVAFGTGASIARNVTEKYVGVASLAFTTGTAVGNSARLTVGTALNATSTYTLSFYAKTASGTMTTLSGSYSPTGAAATETECAIMNPSRNVIATGWTRYSCTINTSVTAATSSGYVAIKQSDTTSRVLYIDGVQIEGGSAITTGLIVNTGLEAASTWAYFGTAGFLSQSSVDKYNGSNSLLVTTTNTANNGPKLVTGNAGTTQLSPNTTYVFSFWMKASGAVTSGLIAAGYSQDGTTVQDCQLLSSSNATTWTYNRCTITTNATAPTSTAFIVIKQTSAPGATRSWYLDDVQLTATTSSVSGGAFRESALSLNGVITSPTTFKNSTNSTAAFQVQNAGGTSLLAVDTLNGNVNVGQGGTPVGQLFVSGQAPTAAASTTIFTGKSLKIVGRRAYSVDSGASTLNTMSVNSNTAPVSIANSAICPAPSSIDVQGRYAYVTCVTNSQLFIYDISNPSVGLVQMGFVNTAASPNIVKISGHYAYVINTSTPVLQVFDIANPAAPVALGTVAIAASGVSLQIVGKYAFVLEPANLQTFDISNPSSIPSGGNSQTGGGSTGLFVQNDTAYITSTTNNMLQAADVTTPNSMFNTMNIGSAITSGATDIFVQGNYAYITSNTVNIMQIIDITSRLEVGRVTLSGAATGLYVVGRNAYVIANGNLQIFDIGGAYIQQLDTGGVESGSISTRNTLTVGTDADIRGGLNVFRGAQIGGGIGVVGSSKFASEVNSATAFQIQNSAAATYFTVDTANAKVIIGSATTDTVQVNLQLDSFSTFADTGICNATTNQGAMYYSTNVNAIRTCQDSSWTDIVTTKDAGLAMFGVVSDSGTSAGDLAGVNASDASDGPCKVYMGSVANSIRWTACTLYAYGRRDIISAQTGDFTTGITATASAYQNLCIFTNGGAPTFGTASATETLASVPTGWTENTPTVCLATIKQIAAGGGIGAIYDTRVFTNSVKVPATISTAVGFGQAVKLSGTLGQATPTAATTDPFYGVVASYSGSTATTTINAIVITKGPVYVKATAATMGTYIRPTATAGYVNTSALVTVAQSDVPYNYLGIALTPMNAPGTQCSITANADTCRGSVLADINIR